MARRGLPKWAIKQAGGNFKKAWRLVKRGRGKKKASRGGKRGNPSNPRRKGIIAKLNAGLRTLRLGLPALGYVQEFGLTAEAPSNLLRRYSGFNLDDRKFSIPHVKTAAGFYAGNVIEAKAMSLLKVPQMAARKKLLSIAANFLPEITAIPHLVQGELRSATNAIGEASVGYWPIQHLSWLDADSIRNAWLAALGGRIGLGLFSRFVGPMINKHLPKGVNV